MRFTNEKIVILYGSQTGNSQDVAERIWRESKRYYFISVVKSMDEYNVVDLVNEQCVIFVCSTTGQGEEPDNMRGFWRFLLRKSLPKNSLCNLRFAVLGLGDSSYTKFNFAAKRLHKRLLQLGGNALIDLGLGDDQHDLGYDAVTDPWIDSLWNNLLTVYPLPVGVNPVEKNAPILPRWNVNTAQYLSTVAEPKSIYYDVRKQCDFKTTVIENTRTTNPDHFQDVRLIKLRTDGQPYSPGDVVTLRPRNLPWQINDFQDVLQTNGVYIKADTRFILNPNYTEIPVPEALKHEVSFQQLCDEYFDLMAVPRRYTFNILSQLTDSELEKEKCLEFTTAEGQEDLYTYVNRPKRNIVEVLRDFPHATKNITPEMLFEIIPPIKPRDFSIASSYKATKDEIHILLAVVKYKTKLKKERYGLCSNYLADLKPGDQITAWLRKGSFKFPSKVCPVIMVGPGTGVAPFRNYVLERTAEGIASSEDLVLFFGCRGCNSDFHCREDFIRLEKENRVKLICAFSRDQGHKVYVQDKILDNQALVWKLLENNETCVFIAGNAKLMPQQVRKAFIDVCENCGNMTKEDAEKYIESMEKQNRYQTECW